MELVCRTHKQIQVFFHEFVKVFLSYSFQRSLLIAIGSI